MIIIKQELMHKKQAKIKNLLAIIITIKTKINNNKLI